MRLGVDCGRCFEDLIEGRSNDGGYVLEKGWKMSVFEHSSYSVNYENHDKPCLVRGAVKIAPKMLLEDIRDFRSYSLDSDCQRCGKALQINLYAPKRFYDLIPVIQEEWEEVIDKHRFDKTIQGTFADLTDLVNRWRPILEEVV